MPGLRRHASWRRHYHGPAGLASGLISAPVRVRPGTRAIRHSPAVPAPAPSSSARCAAPGGRHRQPPASPRPGQAFRSPGLPAGAIFTHPIQERSLSLFKCPLRPSHRSAAQRSTGPFVFGLQCATGTSPADASHAWGRSHNGLTREWRRRSCAARHFRCSGWSSCRRSALSILVQHHQPAGQHPGTAIHDAGMGSRRPPLLMPSCSRRLEA